MLIVWSHGTSAAIVLLLAVCQGVFWSWDWIQGEMKHKLVYKMQHVLSVKDLLFHFISFGTCLIFLICPSCISNRDNRISPVCPSVHHYSVHGLTCTGEHGQTHEKTLPTALPWWFLVQKNCMLKSLCYDKQVERFWINHINRGAEHCAKCIKDNMRHVENQKQSKGLRKKKSPQRPPPPISAVHYSNIYM